MARDATRGAKVAVLPDIVGTALDKGDEIDALAKLAMWIGPPPRPLCAGMLRRARA